MECPLIAMGLDPTNGKVLDEYGHICFRKCEVCPCVLETLWKSEEVYIQCPVCKAQETITLINGKTGLCVNKNYVWHMVGDRVFHKGCGKPCKIIKGA